VAQTNSMMIQVLNFKQVSELHGVRFGFPCLTGNGGPFGDNEIVRIVHDAGAITECNLPFASVSYANEMRCNIICK
jgi:hypothetical protein